MARDLKYRPVDTDFESLERELRGGSESDDLGGIPEQYADLADDYAEEFEVDDSDEARR